MSENKNLELLDSENVETTATEEIVGEQENAPAERTYTQKELDEIVGRRLARNTAKIRKEYDSKYGELESVLKAGTGKEDLSEMTDTFRKFYEGKGIKIEKKPAFSDRDTEVLARSDAEEIIKAGLEEVIEETDRLANLGASKMTAREKVMFKQLAEYRQNAEKGVELSKIGVTEEMYNSKEFNDFASKFSSKTPITEVWEIFNKMTPKKEIRTMGSMTNKGTTDKGVKEFYTRDEALKFTKSDFDKNPELFKAVERSMTKW